MSHEVFISYRRKDLAFVARLHQELEKRGITAWFDKESIEVADHWRTSIAEGIRDCRVFLLVLSPDAVQSVNIRKEVDLAEKHGKPIVPLVWRPTEIPVAFEYALAGIQWIDFHETASQEHFDELADVLKRLLGGESIAQATAGKQTATPSPIPAIAKEPPPATGRRRLGKLKQKQTVSPVALGGMVIAGVVTSFGLDVEDQDFVNGELKWLFHAADHFLQIRRGEQSRSDPIPVPPPPDAERAPNADNRLLPSLDDFDLQMWEGQIEAAFKRIRIRLKNLDILLEREAFKGEAGKGDVYLQNQIRSERLNIVKTLQELAHLMKQAYGIFVSSPDELLELLS